MRIKCRILIVTINSSRFIKKRSELLFKSMYIVLQVQIIDLSSISKKSYNLYYVKLYLFLKKDSILYQRALAFFWQINFSLNNQFQETNRL